MLTLTGGCSMFTSPKTSPALNVCRDYWRRSCLAVPSPPPPASAPSPSASSQALCALLSLHLTSQYIPDT